MSKDTLAFGTRIARRMEKAGMTPAILARRADLAPQTVAAILADPHAVAFGDIVAVSRALGFDAAGVKKTAGLKAIVRRAAREKAEYLVRLVQGTQGLEAQAVDAAARKALVADAYRALLADRGKIWS